MFFILAAYTEDVEKAGWIGRWTPGIGDPTIGGWVTVVAYFAAAWLCYRVISNVPMVRKGVLPWRMTESWFWWGFVAILLALGVNKQLDLQTAFTEGLRVMARKDGWYENRREYQRAFIELFALLSLFAGIAVVYLAWKMPRAVKVAGVGLCYLIAFVLMRATSFHNMDALIHHQVFALKMNWILELLGIATLAFGARLRMRGLRA